MYTTLLEFGLRRSRSTPIFYLGVAKVLPRTVDPRLIPWPRL